MIIQETTETTISCAHPGCDCPTDADHAFCSDYCQEHTGTPTCHCGHDGCEHVEKTTIIIES